MVSHSGFYKGDKKKQKKATKKTHSISNAPVFALPRLIEKKKKEY